MGSFPPFEMISLDLGEGDSVSVGILPPDFDDDTQQQSIDLAVCGSGRFAVSVPLSLEQALDLYRALGQLIDLAKSTSGSLA